MLTVKTSDEAEKIIFDRFGEIRTETEETDLLSAVGRILAADIVSEENVPDFNRSTVDGYAVKASSTFGGSESIPNRLSDLYVVSPVCDILTRSRRFQHGARSVTVILREFYHHQKRYKELF